MIIRRRAGALLVSLLLPFLALVAAQNPSHEITSFQNLPARLFFFDDTTTAVYHDSIEGNVYISQDEGKSWNVADGIPKGEASMVIEHPFDNQYAFVLTKGTKHYRTDDRGKTWRSFDMPARPALVARPLSFHSDPKKYGNILYQGTVCDRIGWGAVCHDETFYTKQAFGDEPKLLLSETTRCQFAHSSKDFKHEAHPDLIYCVAFDTSSQTGTHHTLSSSRLFSSTDFFQNENRVEDLGIGKSAKGVFAFAIVSKFAVVALKDLSPSNDGEMLLYVTVDTKSWAKAQFPHASSARLRENAYTIVESTTHSLAVDVVLHDQSTIGTLFVSNSNGTFFVQSLQDTNRNEMGYVDFEKLYGVDGVGIANVVANADEVEGRGADKLLKTMITFDDGSSWAPLQAPLRDANGQRVSCNPADDDCTLHLHSVTTPHNFGRIFSSPAPGLVMGVGSIGRTLLPYEDCDTFLSTDAGLSWTMVRTDAHKYEFGDSGSVVIAVNDEDGTDSLSYSLDMGQNWRTYNFGVKLRARVLTTVPDSTSQKFLLVGQVARKDQTNNIGRYVIVFLDFAETRSKKCGESDFERWYARAGKSDCLMGHKQWYRRRKPDANCYVGEKFIDPVEHEEDCPCTDADYECDFNFVRNGNECVPVGPEPIEAGACPTPSSKYLGSSGWRKIPGDTCTGGTKDAKVEKDCANAQPKEGEIIHYPHEFPSVIVQHAYFKESTTILVRLQDHSIWQSSNEGYRWNQLHPDERFLAFYHHPHSPDRAYLITSGTALYTTTDAGRSWNKFDAPSPPNTFRAQVLRFHPDADRLIWIGNKDCESLFGNCRAEAQYSRNNGRTWTKIEDYVVNCAWATDTKLNADPTEILCESYQKKEGNQQLFQNNNPLELIEGQGYYSRKKKLFDQVVGFAKFSEFLVVAELIPSGRALDLQVSLDGVNFATGMFPPNMHPETHAYTVLESSTGSLFIHMTMSEPPSPYWGNILKSNSNGTYFVLSVENVNRDERGYVDFEKMIGLDGIALINVVSNPSEAVISGRKTIQSRITHNDGSTWKPLRPPSIDSQGNKYACDHAGCSLHVHGYTERTDPRATYSSPSIVGLIMAVGNVGESLLPYTESDTFLSRDGGFTWQEVHKDAHLWEFGDSGSVLVMANDEEPTDHVLFSTDEGSTWREYQFSQDKMRVKSIVTVPLDTSRKFILLGQYMNKPSESVAVHIDFSALTSKQCQLNVEDPGHDDFELWSPSEDRTELCLFGRQTLYHRRVRDTNCVVGNQPKAAAQVQRNCACAAVDFECEFNYVRNENNECVLVPGTTPLLSEEKCNNGEEFWYERTAYRKIPYSSCEEGERPDRGVQHPCPGFKSKGAFFWWIIIMLPFAFTALIGYWYYRRSGLAKGTIRLPSDSRNPFGGNSGVLDTLASVPWFVIGLAGVAWEWVASRVDTLTSGYSGRRGYRNVPVDEDAQILRFEDEE